MSFNFIQGQPVLEIESDQLISPKYMENEEKSLAKRIQDYLQHWKQVDPDHWENGGELERLALSVGFKASNCSRRCRELVDSGVLERKENEKGHVLYRFKW